ncbi:hypothetical protein DNTS_017249 [Danionella cerebrum]|uniref:Uncharacterized protein n=1 Tax=Danionella cerebrum TaxID=2873325 RepID=A0A553QAA1_9TELE|nr:hypothetical protein DNTS_017249 [Danionella translucida]
MHTGGRCARAFTNTHGALSTRGDGAFRRDSLLPPSSLRFPAGFHGPLRIATSHLPCSIVRVIPFHFNDKVNSPHTPPLSSSPGGVWEWWGPKSEMGCKGPVRQSASTQGIAPPTHPRSNLHTARREGEWMCAEATPRPDAFSEALKKGEELVHRLLVHPA